MANTKSNFNRGMISTLMDDIQRKRNSWYYALGGVNASERTLESVGRSGALDSSAGEAFIRSELVYFNKVNPGSVSRTFKRKDWKQPAYLGNGVYDSSGIKFNSWNDSYSTEEYPTNLEFYYCGVMRPDEKLYDVYVCLDYGNNLTDSSPDVKITDNGCRTSIIPPNGRSSSPIYFDPSVIYNLDTGSEIKPYIPGTSTPGAGEERGDGYRWKYLFSISEMKMKKFADGHHVPIMQGTSSSVTDNGSISIVSVANQGENYPDIQLTNVVIDSMPVEYLTHATNDASDPNVALAQIQSLNNNGSFKSDSITVLRAGSNYLLSGVAAEVVITNAAGGESLGSGAEFEVITAPKAGQPSIGEVVAINVIKPGIGYSTSDKIKIVTGGCEIATVLSRASGSIVRVDVIKKGSGLKTPPVINVQYTPTLGGVTPSGMFAGNSSAKFLGVVNNGQLQSVIINDPGKNYPYDSTTYLTVTGDGQGASVSPVIRGGKIIDVIIENPGEHYTQMKIQAHPRPQNFGSNNIVEAIFEPVLNTGEFSQESQIQSLVEQTAIEGALYAVDYTGRGLSDPPSRISGDYKPGADYAQNVEHTVVITGDGIGATAKVGQIDSAGKILSIVITNPGKGYTWATGYVKDESANAPFHEDEGTTCSFRFIVPPRGGHGAVPFEELNTSGIAIYSSFMTSNSISSLNQDYSIVALLRSPRTIDNKIATKLEGLSTVDVVLDKSSVFTTDEVVYIEENLSIERPRMFFRVVSSEGNKVILVNLNPSPVFLSTVIDGELKSVIAPALRFATILDSKNTSRPGVDIIDRTSGDLVHYVSRESAVTFGVDTGVTFRTYLDIVPGNFLQPPAAGGYDGSWYTGAPW